MQRRGNWAAAAVFFLAGCIMTALPLLIQTWLFAGLFSAGTGFTHEMVYNLVPAWPYAVGGVGFALSLAALLVPRSA